jgi:hypothetical protein
MLELRESGYKSIAFYKERLHSLLFYQKKLNEILANSSTPEIGVRAIAELHRIEMSLHTIFQELPHGQFKIESAAFNSHQLEQCKMRTLLNFMLSFVTIILLFCLIFVFTKLNSR